MRRIRRDCPSRFNPRSPPMSLQDPNVLNPQRRKRVAIVIANPAVSTTTGWPVGFWWSELTHPYHAFVEAGYEVEVFSPDGGACVADAHERPQRRQRLQQDRPDQPGLHPHAGAEGAGRQHPEGGRPRRGGLRRHRRGRRPGADVHLRAGATDLHAQVRRVLRGRQGGRGAVPRQRDPGLRQGRPTASTSPRAAPSPASPTSRRTSPTTRCGATACCRATST